MVDYATAPRHASHIGVPVPVPATPVPILLLANACWEAVDGGSVA